MYASLCWDTHPGAEPPATIVGELTATFDDGREVVWLLSNAVLFRVRSRIEYLRIHEALEEVCGRFADQAHYAIFCHDARQPYRGVEHATVDLDDVRRIVE